MDDQTGAEQARAVLRDTVIDARPVEAEMHTTEARMVAEPMEQLRPAHLGVPMSELRPMEVAEPTEQLRPAHLGVPMEQLQPAHVAEPTAELRPMERGRPMEVAEPTAELRPMERGRPMERDARDKRTASTTGAAAQSGGSAGSGFQVVPEQYQAAVSPVLAAADQLAQLVTGLSAYLEHTQSTAPWGNDESGKKFAEGEKGYLKYSADTLKGLKGMPEAVRYVADGLKAMAANYQSAEDGNASAFQDDGGSDAVSVPQVGTYSAPVNVTPVRPTTIRRA